MRLRSKPSRSKPVRLKPWALIAVLAVSIATLLWAISFYRYRFVRSDRDLFRFLPEGDATIFYVNVAALRRAGMLHFVTGAKGTEEADYLSFVRETRLDYRKDIDAIAGAADSKQVLFLVKGRFDWNTLRSYAAAHGGSCAAALCEAPTSRTGTWASFVSVQPDVMGLALSADRAGAEALRPPGHAFHEAIPDSPAWARVSPTILKKPASLPVALRIFAISLQFANPVVLSLGAADEHSEEFKLQLDAQCANPAMAETVRSQLELDTKKIGRASCRERV